MARVQPNIKNRVWVTKKSSGWEESWEPQRNRLLDVLPSLRLHIHQRRLTIFFRFYKVELQQVADNLTSPEGIETRIPLRAINSYIGSSTYELSKYLASVLEHLTNKTEYSVKNAK